MAFTSVTSKVDSGVMSRRIVQVLSGGAGTGDLIDLEVLPYGSAHFVLTSGTAITNVQITVANDGLVGTQTIPVLKNPVNLGPALTTMPNMAALNVGGIIAAGPSTFSAGNPVIGTVNRFVQFVVSGGDATTVLTITIEMMGSRG
jgi:hypothetical protein